MKTSKMLVAFLTIFGLQAQAAVDFDQIGRILREEVQYSSTDQFDQDCGDSGADTQALDQSCKLEMITQQRLREKAFEQILGQISDLISGIIGAQNSISQGIENLGGQDSDRSQAEINELKRSGSLATLQISGYANNAKLLKYTLVSVRNVDQKTYNKAVLIKSIVANLYQESKKAESEVLGLFSQ